MADAATVSRFGQFGTRSKHIAAGDCVIAYSGPQNMTFITVKAGAVFANSYGRYPHDSIIGVEWGSKHPSATGRGFIHLLWPTPELWTLSLPHRTQILYTPDISFITSFLDLRPGVKMIEAGTGSGSFSHAIARTIAPTGHLYTFEYNADRYEKALVEFQEHGLTELVTLEHRDVCSDGFEQRDLVDAVFLDLPSPWEALEAAKQTFKKHKTGKICCFSPCVEQVLRTTAELQKQGFVEIKMFEVLVRSYDSRKTEVRPLPTRADEEQRRHDIGNKKRKEREAAASSSASDAANPAKKVATEDGSVKVELAEEKVDEAAAAPASVNVSQPQEVRTVREFTGLKPPREATGHTSYLTFATLLPQIYRGSDGEKINDESA
ncbi:tRNA (adenine-N(1)-)-methyltransferase catalytic subunit trm61 [Geranomyces variabilis]|uniref:tRNA (adenine(58)-N(1))-methyltransferase catalytic subunit TRM61 n=1 Tax=Geranomyces variabilis TaxID=109894 RepID=A0AAD5XNF0_9FUNG|nr:tRNA (adenine-N(1)-)-methyltransferase catalytic subunit trm61 [Geranomyces variabilis]